MRAAAIVFCFLCAAIAGASQAEAKPGGCLKYGAAGAVAGHYAGHHAVKGAVAGCMAGIVRRHAYEKEMQEQKQKQMQQQDQPPPDQAK